MKIKELPKSNELHQINKKDLVCAIVDAQANDPSVNSINIDTYYNMFWREPRKNNSYSLTRFGVDEMSKFYHKYSSPVGMTITSRLVVLSAKHIQTPYWLCSGQSQIKSFDIFYFDDNFNVEMGIYEELKYYLNAYSHNLKVF